jgi:hypothetical protein
VNVPTAFAVLILAVAPIAQAQSPTTTITGIITDQTGASIPKAKVNLETAILMIVNGTVLQTTTDIQGRFTISAEPGYYTLSASAYGFKVMKQPIRLTEASLVKNISLAIDPNQQVCSPCIEPMPYIEPLNAFLTTTLPLYPMPPFKLRIKKSTYLGYDARVPHS